MQWSILTLTSFSPSFSHLKYLYSRRCTTFIIFLVCWSKYFIYSLVQFYKVFKSISMAINKLFKHLHLSGISNFLILILRSFSLLFCFHCVPFDWAQFAYLIYSCSWFTVLVIVQFLHFLFMILYISQLWT